MKRRWVLYCLVVYLLFPTLTYAQLNRWERGRELRTLRYSGNLVWNYQSVMFKNQRPYSYFSQSYNLNLSGPLGLPALGQTKIDLGYRLGKNELTLPLMGKPDLRGYYYTFSFWFAPRVIRNFFSSNFSFSQNTKNQFSDTGMSPSSALNTSQLVTLDFFPPGQINLSRLFGRNNRNARRNKSDPKDNFLVFSFPGFSYLYVKTNTNDGNSNSQSTFNQDSIIQRLYTFYDYHRLKLRYTYETKETVDLLRKRKFGATYAHNYDANLFTTQVKFLSGLAIRANRSSSGSLEPKESPTYQRTNLNLMLSGKTIRFFGVASYLQSNHSFTQTGMVSSQYQSIANGLLLNSSLSLLRRIPLRNVLSYAITQSGGSQPVQKISETIDTSYAPLTQVRLSGYFTVSDTYNQSKTRESAQFVRVDFIPFSFLSSYGEIGLNQTKDLIAKEITAQKLDSTFFLSAGISPVGVIYSLISNNNNNNNHKNGNGNGNGNRNGYLNGNLLNLGTEIKVKQTKDLLNKTPTGTVLTEMYRVNSSPFGSILVFDLVYRQIKVFIENKMIISENYLDLNIGSQKSLLFYGLSLDIKVQLQQLRKVNLELNLNYKVRQSSFVLRHRIFGYSPSNGTDYRVTNITFSRRI